MVESGSGIIPIINIPDPQHWLKIITKIGTQPLQQGNNEFDKINNAQPFQQETINQST
jgi:hypothetical protein